MLFFRRFLNLPLMFYVLISFSGFVHADESMDSSKLEKVIVGLYPINIMSFDTHDGSLKMSFYVWYKTFNHDFKPDSVEVINSPDAAITSTSTGENKGKQYFTTIHYQATLDHHWSFKDFPFDCQTFKVILEAANPIDVMKLVPDYEQSNPNTNIKIDNWKFVKSFIESSETLYNTNFGDMSGYGSKYSRVTFYYQYQHEGWRIFLNLFGAFFVCAIFCIMTNLFDDSDIRIQLILTAVIGFIGNKYIVDGIVPEVSEFTLSDAIQAATFATMLIALAGLLVERYIEDKYKKPINMTFTAVSSIGYIGYVSYQLYSALYAF